MVRVKAASAAFFTAPGCARAGIAMPRKLTRVKTILFTFKFILFLIVFNVIRLSMLFPVETQQIPRILQGCIGDVCTGKHLGNLRHPLFFGELTHPAPGTLRRLFFLDFVM